MKLNKMAALFLTLPLFMQCASTTLKENEYSIKGKIEGADVKHGYIMVIDKAAPRGVRFDSAAIENGVMDHIGTIKQPEVVSMSFRSDKITKWVGQGKQRGYLPVKSALLQFIAFPGAKIELKGNLSDFVNVYAYGDDENKVLSSFLSEINPVLNESANYYVKTVNDTTLTEAQVKEYEKKSMELGEKANAIRIKFLEKNASSIAGLWLIEDMLMRSQIDLSKAEECFKTVDATKYADLSYYKNVRDRIKAVKATAIGQIAPAIEGVDMNTGKSISLQSMNDKYVLIDFWGTWCGPCMNGMPEMKAFRDKHKEKLQILGLAKDRNAEEVKKVLDKVGMDWPNILIGEGEADFVSKYNVQGYPTKILVDQKGKILLRSMGEDPKFYQQIEDIIK